MDLSLDILGLKEESQEHSSGVTADNVHIVVGANYGDEGKGATVAALTKKYSLDYGFRFNGGNQAGHTVIVNGKRRVYNSFSCAHAFGAESAGYHHFMVSPAYVNDEFKKLSDETHRSQKFLAHPDCAIITPWDIAANQIKEQSRATRHGSVGKGIFECYSRWYTERPMVNVNHFIQGTWLNMAELTNLFEKDFLDNMKSFNSKLEVHSFLPKLRQLFSEYPYLINSSVEELDTSNVGNSVVFEGAQGLLLSMDNKAQAPHLTPSKTDPEWAVDACQEMGLVPASINYVTRPYLTRHGAGPVPDRVGALSIDNWTKGLDLTNAPNPWQGSIRYFHIYWSSLIKRLDDDYKTQLSFIPGHLPKPVKRLVVTCTDQVVLAGPHYQFYAESGTGFKSMPTKPGFLKALKSEIEDCGWDGKITFLNGLTLEVEGGDDL